MDAVEYLVNKARYCIFSGCNCEKCQIFNECASDLDSLTKKQAQRMVDVVEQWAKEHPVKTRQSEFLKIYPEAEIFEGRYLNICPALISKEYRSEETNECNRPEFSCGKCKRDYWLKEI